MGPEPVSEPVIESDICECTECGAKACVPCDRPWHEGEDCAAYQARIKDRLEEENKTLEVSQAPVSDPELQDQVVELARLDRISIEQLSGIDALRGGCSEL